MDVLPQGYMIGEQKKYRHKTLKSQNEPQNLVAVWREKVCMFAIKSARVLEVHVWKS